MEFRVKSSDGDTSARCGLLVTDRGDVPTPAFIPIGTYGAVKALSPRDLESAGASILLGNAYHLYLRPGLEVIRGAGGLHSFMGWNGPILTDSGGFQVFSLVELRRITDDGVVFKSMLDGSQHELTPEKSMAIQRILGSDIIMTLDVCPPGNVSHSHVQKAVERTSHWAKRCFEYLRDHSPPSGKKIALFPIVQGSVFEDLRRESSEQLIPYAETGIAVGGLAVGEEKLAMFETVSLMNELLPGGKVRYLMGVGKPKDIVQAVRRGMDLFDCVIPTRNARNGQLFTWNGKINLRNERYAGDFSAIDNSCPCYACQTFSRAYLRHLFKLNEILGLQMASLHNVTFYLSLMAKMREEIEKGTFDSWSRGFLSRAEEEKDG